jgi:hypothetical protein
MFLGQYSSGSSSDGSQINLTINIVDNDEIMEMLADYQMKHGEPPTEADIEGMYDAIVGSASQEYQIAH